VTFKNNQLRGIVSTQLASLVVNNLNCVIPGKQVQTHFVDDLILQVGKNRKMKAVEITVLCKVLL